MTIVHNKCGSKGCSVEEHDKRLGYDQNAFNDEYRNIRKAA